MKVITATVTAVGLIVALSAGPVLAGQTRTVSGKGAAVSSKGTSATRPADSQRKDGTFLTTGTTANGSTTRPANGKGVMDGTGILAPTTPTTVQ